MSALRNVPFGQFLDQIAAKSPAPGGGAVASAVGALAASLANMVVAYSLGKKTLAEHQPALERAGHTLARTVEMLLELADEDAAAYALVNELGKLPEGDARRVSEYPAAVQAAVQAPRNVVAVACDLLRLLEHLSTRTNRHLRSDLAIAAILAEAAARAGWWNVLVNLALLESEDERAELRAEMTRLLSEAAIRRTAIEQACAGE